jgi:ABC-type transport system substrate-binding protein
MSQSGNNRTGWKSARYDQLIRDANNLTDRQQREELLRQAETILIAEEVPIVPVYFYAGSIFFRDQEIKGIYANVLDEHPVQDIFKIGPKSKVQSPKSRIAGFTTGTPTLDFGLWTLDLSSYVFP